MIKGYKNLLHDLSGCKSKHYFESLRLKSHERLQGSEELEAREALQAARASNAEPQPPNTELSGQSRRVLIPSTFLSSQTEPTARNGALFLWPTD